MLCRIGDQDFLFLRDGALDINEFEQMLKSLFSFYGNSYFISKAKIKSMFNFFDENKVNIHLNSLLIFSHYQILRTINLNFSKRNYLWKNSKFSGTELLRLWVWIHVEIITWKSAILLFYWLFILTDFTTMHSFDHRRCSKWLYRRHFIIKQLSFQTQRCRGGTSH